MTRAVTPQGLLCFAFALGGQGPDAGFDLAEPLLEFHGVEADSSKFRFQAATWASSMVLYSCLSRLATPC